MRISYSQLRATPYEVILRDLEYMDIEASIEQGKAQRMKDAKP